MSDEQRDKIAREAWDKIMSECVEDYDTLEEDAAKAIIADALDEYADGLREKALREAAKAVCLYECRDFSAPVVQYLSSSGKWRHERDGEIGFHCKSSAIHDLIAAMQADDGGENLDD